MAKNKNCQLCKRPPHYFDGCSHVDCPKRKTLTAAHEPIVPTLEQVVTSEISDYVSCGTYKVPTNTEE